MPRPLDPSLAALPHRYKGPGGAAAVLQDGRVVASHAWGYANAERAIPFTPATLVRLCSITKQFTCATLLDAFPDPTILDADVPGRLPRLQQPAPTILHLCHNQSGLRDYWAVAMLHGAPAESAFGDRETAQVIGATSSLQFAPGARFSYVNQNFRLISDIVQHRLGHPFAHLLRSRVFDRVGMPSALLAADTAALPDGTEGYEGNQAIGFRPAVNRILWTGDAGIAASLDDMIAWERHIDATRDDPAALYQRLSAPVAFGDGASAGYGFGLGRRTERGRAITSHGGALRGWRTHRLHSAADRLSVVVLFNHMADAHAAALDLFAAALALEPLPEAAAHPVPAWLGAFIEPETGLAVRMAHAGSHVRLHYGQSGELLPLQPDGSAGKVGTRLRPTASGLWMDRPQDNQATLLRPLDLDPAPLAGLAGRYRCPELDANLTIADAGGTLYGGFSGVLGTGRMELLDPIGADTWALPCPRALDHSPPGDWTLAFERDGIQTPRVIVGCWLARNLVYTRCP